MAQLMNALSKIRSSMTKHTSCKEEFEVCDFIANVAVNVGHPLMNIEGEIYCFVGSHWEKIPPEKIKALLLACNCIISGDNVKGKDYRFIDKLNKQLPYTVMYLNTNQAKDKINFHNGTLDLTTMILNRHNTLDYFRYVLPYGYDSKARCPLFQTYLDRVMPDKSAQDVLAEYIAWLFVPDLKLEKVLFLYGEGCNGKSVFIDIVEALVGKDNVSHESISDMCNGERGANHRSNIIGKLLNTCSDVAPTAFSGDVFKRMASGEPISAKILYSDVITTTNYPKMIFCLNELPKTSDHSKGYFRRFIIAPFKVQIPKKEIDPKLAEKVISNELPGIMNWVLKGRQRLLSQGGFSECCLFEKANEDYQNDSTGKIKLSKILLPPFFK